MISVYGTNGKRELLERVGDLRQIAGYQRLSLSEGKGTGNEIIQVRNGSGLFFQISLSRGFDIGYLEYQGIPISWMSQTGPVAPSYYDKESDEWNRSFEGGMLATCGLSTMGKPSVDQGKAFGQHGRISSTPAELLQSEGYWTEDGYELIFRGKVREAKALEEHLTLHRTVRTRLGESRITIEDAITNEAFLPAEHLVLYHFNFGFPLISESCRIFLPASRKKWIKGEGPEGSWERFGPPTVQAEPTVLAHELLCQEGDTVIIRISNNIRHNQRTKQLMVQLRYTAAACPFLTQWKHERSGAYVLGIEPGNATTEGRGVHRVRGTLPYLQPGETKRYSFELQFDLQEDVT
jgi:hypothetical protein